MKLDSLQIQEAATKSLKNLGRTSFSSKGFSDEEINAIANAITAAITAYDKQKEQKS